VPAIRTLETDWGARLIPAAELERYIAERVEGADCAVDEHAVRPPPRRTKPRNGAVSASASTQDGNTSA
jgi:hypothetical protein